MTYSPLTLLPARPIRTEADIVFYENEAPLNARIPGTIYELFQHSAAAWPDRTAITFLTTADPDAVPRRLTYRALLEAITRAVNAFTEAGGPSPGVAYLLPSLPETQICLWAAETAGHAVPLNPLLKTEQLRELIEASGASVLVCCGPRYSEDMWSKACNLRDQLPNLVLLCLDPPSEALSGRVRDLEQVIGDADASRINEPPPAVVDRVIAYFHTGGTTGSPKLVAQTDRGQLTAALGAVVMLGTTEQDVVTNGMPLFHIGGAIGSSLGPFMAGAELVMLSGAGFRNPEMVRGLWKIVERFGVTILSAVPTALSAILTVPVDGDISSVRYGITGAASTPRATAEKFKSITGRSLHEVLGMTESSGVTAVEPAAGDPTLGSVGYRLPYTKLTVRQLTADGGLGDVCAPGTPGVLTVSGPTVSPGYKNRADSSEVFVDGQLNTGDLAYFDEDGKLHIVGRAKDLIIRSGHNIDPAMIEDAIAGHPDVALCAAVGQPDTYAGELPVCYVALKPGATVSAEELMEFAKERVDERPAWPKAVYIIPEIPLTGVGKIYKPALRADATRRIVTLELQALDVSAELLSVEAEGAGGIRVTVEISDQTSGSIETVRAALSRFSFRSYVNSRSAGAK